MSVEVIQALLRLKWIGLEHLFYFLILVLLISLPSIIYIKHTFIYTIYKYNCMYVYIYTHSTQLMRALFYITLSTVIGILSSLVVNP